MKFKLESTFYLFNDIAHHNEYILMALSWSAGRHECKNRLYANIMLRIYNNQSIFQVFSLETHIVFQSE